MVNLSEFSHVVKITALIVFGLLFYIVSPNILPYNLRFPLWIFMTFIGLPILLYIIWQRKSRSVEGGRNIPHETPNYWEISPYSISEKKIRDYLDRAKEEQKEAGSEMKNEVNDNVESEKAQSEDKSVTDKRKHPRRMVR